MNRIRELRKVRGMNQDDLAKMLNVQRAAVSKYENGSIPLTDDTLLRLSRMFDVSIDYLLRRTDDPALPSQLPRDLSIDETLARLGVTNAEHVKTLKFIIDLMAMKERIKQEESI